MKYNSNGAYWRNSLSKIKDRAYVINLDEYKSIETHWIDLHLNGSNGIFFDSFGVKHIPKEVKKKPRKQKYHKYLQNTIFLYWIYWFYSKK